MLNTLSSYFAALRASLRLGRANRLRKRGEQRAALAVARDGLAILGHPHVKRLNAAEGSALACLTMLVEELGSELNQPGASLNDLKNSLEFLKQLPAASSGDSQQMLAWITYLEARNKEDGGIKT